MQKINPTLSDLKTNFKTISSQSTKIEFNRIILQLVKKDRLNVRIPESLCIGFYPNQMQQLSNTLDGNNRMCTRAMCVENDEAQALLYLIFGLSYIRNKCTLGRPGIIIKRGSSKDTTCELASSISEMDSIFMQYFGSGQVIAQTYIKPKGTKASTIRCRYNLNKDYET